MAAVSAGVVQLPPNSTGKIVDTSELTVGANTAERQNICLADPTTAANVSNIILPAGSPTAQVANGALATAAFSMDGLRATYGAANIGFSAGTSATTDIWTFYGSATKTIKVLQVQFSSTTATAAAYYDVILALRSTAPSSGANGTAAVRGLFDSNNAAVTAAAPLSWTTAPTAGSGAGNIAIWKYFSVLTGTVTTSQIITWAPPSWGQAITLRGTSQGIALTLNAATPANAQSWDVSVIWTEDAS